MNKELIDEKLNAEVQEQARLLGISAERELSLLSQLAASQAREAKLREALSYVIEDLELRASMKWDEDERDVVDIGDGAYKQANEALKQPADDTALRELITKAGEVMRERCIAVTTAVGSNFDGRIEKRILTLPSVTLEDLK